MSTVVVTLFLLCLTVIAAGVFLWFIVRRRSTATSNVHFSKPNQRKLTQQERDAVEQYLRQNEKLSQTPITHRSNLMLQRDKLTLTAKSESVYTVTRAITRYGVASEEPNKWRYFLETTEIHLPPFWEQYIAHENHVELIKTQTVPLVISLNGHSLVDHIYERSAPGPSVIPTPPQNASIRHEESEHIQLVKVRYETREEHALTRSNGVREALAISAVMLLLFITLVGPAVILPWMLAIAALLLGWVGWRFLAERLGKNRKEIHCLRGQPKRWGLFGESKQGDISNISLGAVDLIYPPHWHAYIGRDLGQPTDVELYMNSQVVRQGAYLSLHDEVKNFPLQLWGKNLVLAASALVLLVMLLIYVPLGLPLKLSLAWLQGAQSTQVSSVQALEKTPLRVGDTLKVQGTGMCYVPPANARTAPTGFMPFDCSGIYWNEAAPLPMPESESIDAATALLTTVNTQLHPGDTLEQNINPQLATAIEKSGMILLDDFSDIVLKTQTLCSTSDDCVRLKNALVNLGNADNWATLVKRAKSGTLKGMNVLLRPVSAQSLSELVNTATSSFFAHETRRAAETLNSPPPGGFLISNDEGKQLVEQPVPPVSLYAYNPLGQWKQLQNLSSMLLHTPFSAQGVITNISTDANGTRHISLHSEPDISTLWRYLGTSLLLLLLIVFLLLNSILLVKRRLKDKYRMNNIQNYYNNCFNPTLVTTTVRSLD
ncbi:intracellular growth attenuator family protein [Ewingella americana]|uniref:Intracellular growth attenuator family protein n=1 Tax=Ewingella americana TaxID=41202 RepID=A0A502G9X2_9GAMM|nr:intracellular growth attenuator family protein [Ewingella americana]TPG58785.1 intracellular growth attenuator family protein [Ewingella americana]